jgi:tripartite-type tricarboxylate transporter receptor subunit TctC
MQFVTLEESRMARPLAFLLLLACSAVLHAQDAYPTKPITMIVPFPPGGVADITGRPLAAMMERSLKQPVVVVNRTGAGGALGMSQVAKSVPDGYTLLMGLSSISIFPVSDRINGKQPAYEMKDFAPIALISSDPTVLVVRAEGPYKTLKDFVDAAKANPGKINYSSSGVYGTLHVAMEIFANAAGIKLFHVPYGGGGPAVNALLGGQVEALASGPAAAIGQIKGGKMRALAAWSDKRLALMPDLPTFKELGYDAEFYIWAGVFAPVATPQPILVRLREAVRAAVNDPDFKAAMDKVATPISYLDAPEFQKFWDHDAKRLAVALEKIGKVEEKK